MTSQTPQKSSLGKPFTPKNDQPIDKVTKQIYLLVAGFLNRTGHAQAAHNLIKVCESSKLFPPSVNWQGEMEGASDEELPSLEVLLRNLIVEDSRPAIGRVGDLLSLAGKLRGRLADDGGSRGESRVSEIRSPLRFPLRGVMFNFRMPWSLGCPWADNLLAVTATRFLHLKTITGHRLPSYCALFDRSDRRIITGGDDGIVKIWCSRTGLLLYSLRSHSNCISDIGLDPSNTVLAVGSIDGYLTFWDIRVGHHLFTINAYSPILTLEFRPVAGTSKELVLMTTCSDGYAKFWSINLQQRTWSTMPVKFHCKSLARDEIRCASFSPAGLRFITGATDGIVRLFSVPEASDIKVGAQPSILLPYVQYLEDHEGYINSIHYSTKGTEFATSSSDGTIRKWKYEGKWISDSFSTSEALDDNRSTGKPRKVTIVTFCNNDESIVAAVNQGFELIIFDSKQQKKAIPLRFHRGEVYILSANPADDRIVLSAGCDGQAALWNIQTGTMIFEFHLEHTRFLDGGFSQNGTMFTLVDDLGRVSVFGCGMSPDTFSLAPSSQFFHDDWNELIFDSQHNAIDAITQRPPHLSTRERIYSIERNPYDLFIDSSYPLSIPIDMDEGVVQRQQQLYQKQFEAETDLFKREKENTPPGAVPKHTRSRRKRVLYGSDVEDEMAVPTLDAQQIPLEESVDEDYRIGSQASETDAEVGITSTDHEPPSPGPYNFRRRLTEVSPVVRGRGRRSSGRLSRIPEFDDDEEILYRPDRTFRHRATPRRRPIASESDEDSGPFRVSKSRQAPKWLAIKDRQVFPYLPQIYDVVTYFPEGHKLFLANEKGIQFHDNLPWETEGISSLPSVVFGQVISLNFFPGSPPWCLIELLLLSHAEVCESLPPPVHIPVNARRIQIAFYDMDNQPDFIIPYCRYHWSVQPVQRYTVGEIVRVVFGRDETYEAKIKKVKVSPDRIPDRPWQCYHIEWLSIPDDPESLSPWELETIFEEDSPEREPYSCSEHIDPEILRQLDEGLQRLMNDPRGALFRRAVDTNQFPDYLDEVAYPMDLTFLHHRVINGYYRRIEAFEWDARLLYDNAFTYNLPTSDIVEDADFVLAEILRMVKRAERGTRRFSRHLSSHLEPTQASRRDGSYLGSTRISRREGSHLESMRISRRGGSHSRPINLAPPMRRGAAEREARARRRAGLDLPRPLPEQPRPKRRRIITSRTDSEKSREESAVEAETETETEKSKDEYEEEEFEMTTPRRTRLFGRRHSPRNIEVTPPNQSRNLRRSVRFTH